MLNPCKRIDRSLVISSTAIFSFMKKIISLTLLSLLSLSFVVGGCAKDPGRVPDVPMTEEQHKENERVGAVP